MLRRSAETERHAPTDGLSGAQSPAPALSADASLGGLAQPAVVLQLQRTAGNAAVAGLVAGRGAAHTRRLQRMPPDQTRTDPDIEKQRQEAIRQVNEQCVHIQTAAESNGVAPEAIAGAILWEALENPYRRSFWRLGPGKVHALELGEKSEAEKVEAAQLVPAVKDQAEREARLQTPEGAVTYIAAIMGRHARNYLDIAGADIRQDVGVLCTLYQGGHSEARAQKLAARRKADPNAQPVAADAMGPWVVANLDWIKSKMGCARPPESSVAPGEGAA